MDICKPDTIQNPYTLGSYRTFILLVIDASFLLDESS